MAKITNTTATDAVRVYTDTAPAAPLLEALTATVATLGEVAAGDELTLSVTRTSTGWDEEFGREWAGYTVAASARSATPPTP